MGRIRNRKEGKLKREEKRSNEWVISDVVLSHSALYLIPSSQEEEHLFEEISLVQCMIAYEPQKHHACFSLSNKINKHYLCAKTEKEMFEWVESIQQQIKTLPHNFRYGDNPTIDHSSTLNHLAPLNRHIKRHDVFLALSRAPPSSLLSPSPSDPPLHRFQPKFPNSKIEGYLALKRRIGGLTTKKETYYSVLLPTKILFFESILDTKARICIAVKEKSVIQQEVKVGEEEHSFKIKMRTPTQQIVLLLLNHFDLTSWANAFQSSL